MSVAIFLAGMLAMATDPVLLAVAIAAGLLIRDAMWAAAAGVVIGFILQGIVVILSQDWVPIPFERGIWQRMAAALMLVFAVRGVRAFMRWQKAP